jgi:beta-lactamase class A
MKFTRRHYLYLLGAGLSAAPANTLADRWRQIASETDGAIGAAAVHLEAGQHVSLHGDDRFPLASVCKLPIAMHILAMVDKGKLSRSAPIEVIRRDVTTEVSEVGERWPKQRRFPLDELLRLMVAKSDNTAVETLYRIGGGAAAIAARLQGWNLDGIRIDRSERQCNRDAAKSMRLFIADPRDTGTPDGTAQLLKRVFRGELLSASSTARIVEILKATSTGPARIKGLLPPAVNVLSCLFAQIRVHPRSAMKHLTAMLLAAASLTYAQAPGPIALRGARVVTVSGPVLEKGTVLLRNGLIEAVGENVDLPKDAWVVDAQGVTVYPGLIDALSTVGLPETPAQPTTPRTETPATPHQGRARPARAGGARSAVPPLHHHLGARGRSPESGRPAHRGNPQRRFHSVVAFPSTGIFAGEGAFLNLSGEKQGRMVVLRRRDNT